MNKGSKLSYEQLEADLNYARSQAARWQAKYEAAIQVRDQLAAQLDKQTEALQRQQEEIKRLKMDRPKIEPCPFCESNQATYAGRRNILPAPSVWEWVCTKCGKTFFTGPGLPVMDGGE